MARDAQRYVTELLVELLGPAEIEKRFDWCRGDTRDPAVLGVRLPYDAAWEARKLIVEVDERQHGEAVAFFDKPGRMTVSGVHRGEQRQLYDERKVRLAREQGYTRRANPDDPFKARTPARQGPSRRPGICQAPVRGRRGHDRPRVIRT